MSKDREEKYLNSTKHSKKHGASDTSLNGFLKKQLDLMSELKIELQNSNAEKQQIKFAAMERNKCIQELKKTIEDRDAEIKSLESALSAALEENKTTVQRFNLLKDNLYELETLYDSNIKLKDGTIKRLTQNEAQTKQEMTLCQETMRKQEHEHNQVYAKLVLDYAALKETFEKNQKIFAQQQKHFEDFQKQVEVEKNTQNETFKNEIIALKQELLHRNEEFQHECEMLRNELNEKDELIRACIQDKDILEDEKNRKIQELNYKIKQIEKVFGQPTKTVTPVISVPNTPQTAQNKEQTAKTVYNVAFTKPQLRLPQPQNILAVEEKNMPANNSNRVPDNSLQRTRPKKIPRPSHMERHNENMNGTSYKTNNERINTDVPQQLRNPSPPPSKRASFSSTGDDEDDDISIPQWGPNRYVPETETDASESFFKPKRAKK